MKNQNRIHKAPALVHLFFTTRIGVILYLILNNPIHYSRIPIVLISILISFLGFPVRFFQRLLFRKKIQQVSFTQNLPVFVIGHFRSGTTFLHAIMSKDRQFGTPTIYHALFINYCLIGGSWLKRMLSPLIPKKRIQDNVKISLDEPDEEEIALFCYSRHNGLTDYFFPRNPHYHDQYILFQGGYEQERLRWEQKYTEVLKVIAISKGTTKLLLKNPFNTARILELNRMFPGSRFVFIIRNPYEIYASTWHWYQTLIIPLSLQPLDEKELEFRILERFRDMMAKYLRIREQLPKGSYTELTFEELQEDPISVVHSIYENLNLTGLELALPEMKNYLSSLEDYKKNLYKPLSDRLVKRINQEWGFVFREWGYPLRDVES